MRCDTVHPSQPALELGRTNQRRAHPTSSHYLASTLIPFAIVTQSYPLLPPYIALCTPCTALSRTLQTIRATATSAPIMQRNSRADVDHGRTRTVAAPGSRLLLLLRTCGQRSLSRDGVLRLR